MDVREAVLVTPNGALWWQVFLTGALAGATVATIVLVHLCGSSIARTVRRLWDWGDVSARHVQVRRHVRLREGDR